MHPETHSEPNPNAPVLPLDVNQLAAEAAGVRLETDKIDRPYAVDDGSGKRIPVNEAKHRIGVERITQGAFGLGAVTIEAANASVVQEKYGAHFDPSTHRKGNYLERRDAERREKEAKAEEFAKNDDAWMQRMSETASRRDYRHRQLKAEKVLAERRAERKGEEKEFDKLRWQHGEGVINLDPKKYKAMAAENYAAKKQAKLDAAAQKESERRAHLLSLAQEQRSASQNKKVQNEQPSVPPAEYKLANSKREEGEVVHDAHAVVQRKLDRTNNLLRSYADAVNLDGKVLSDRDKKAIRHLISESMKLAKTSIQLDATEQGSTDMQARFGAHERYTDGLRRMFSGIDLKTEEEQKAEADRKAKEEADAANDKHKDTIKLSKPAAAAAVAAVPAPAVTGEVAQIQPVAARPNGNSAAQAERRRPKSRRGRLALLIAGLAAAGAGAGLWGANALKDDAKKDATELSTDDTSGSTTTFEDADNSAGQSGASEKSPEDKAFDAANPYVWNRMQAAINESGRTDISATNEIVKLAQSKGLTVIDLPGNGDRNIVILNPDGTDATDSVASALGFTTKADYLNYVKNLPRS